eukprot:3974338-Amphidinium_carterae.1
MHQKSDAFAADRLGSKTSSHCHACEIAGDGGELAIMSQSDIRGTSAIVHVIDSVSPWAHFEEEQLAMEQSPNSEVNAKEQLRIHNTDLIEPHVYKHLVLSRVGP